MHQSSRASRHRAYNLHRLRYFARILRRWVDHGEQGQDENDESKSNFSTAHYETSARLRYLLAQLLATLLLDK